MLMPKKNRVAIYEHLFKEGVMVAKKDHFAPKHQVGEWARAFIPVLIHMWHPFPWIHVLRLQEYQYRWCISGSVAPGLPGCLVSESVQSIRTCFTNIVSTLNSFRQLSTGFSFVTRSWRACPTSTSSRPASL